MLLSYDESRSGKKKTNGFDLLSEEGKLRHVTKDRKLPLTTRINSFINLIAYH